MNVEIRSSQLGDIISSLQLSIDLHRMSRHMFNVEVDRDYIATLNRLIYDLERQRDVQAGYL